MTNSKQSTAGETLMLPANELQKTKTREIGFEILRIIAMFLICCVHLINFGGIMKNAPDLIAINLVYSFFTVAVNVFVLISGYFLVNSTISLKKILKLWLQVAFYSVISYLLATMVFQNQIGSAFSVKDLIKSFFPVLGNAYWFFSAYFLLYITSPFINKILKGSTKKQLIWLLAGIFVLNFCISKSMKIIDVFDVFGGYSYIWFVELYLIAGYIRLYPPKIKRVFSIIVFFIATLLTWLFACCPPTFVNSTIYSIIHSGIEYNSYIVMIASICLFLSFKGITTANSKALKAVSFVSSCTFGVYLFQESAIKPLIYFNILQVQNIYGSPASALYVLLFAAALFAMGFACELVRKLFFKLTSPPIEKFYSFVKNKDVKN